MSKILDIAANKKIAGDVFHAGEFLMEEMEARGLRQIDLANQIGASKTEISLIVNGKRGITVPMAVKLEKVLGISAETWMNLQIKFEIETLKQKENQNYKFVKASKKDIKRRNKVLL